MGKLSWGCIEPARRSGPPLAMMRRERLKWGRLKRKKKSRQKKEKKRIKEKVAISKQKQNLGRSQAPKRKKKYYTEYVAPPNI